jgi:hypothetical protein
VVDGWCTKRGFLWFSRGMILSTVPSTRETQYAAYTHWWEGSFHSSSSLCVFLLTISSVLIWEFLFDLRISFHLVLVSLIMNVEISWYSWELLYGVLMFGRSMLQDLVTKGLIHPVKIHDELIAREIIINDADPGVRYKLTKRQTQEEVCFLFWALRRANRFCDLNKLTVQLNCFCCAKNWSCKNLFLVALGHLFKILCLKWISMMEVRQVCVQLSSSSN